MLFLQINNFWINARYITSIHRYDGGIEIHFGEKEEDGIMTLRDSVEVDALLHWLTEEALTHIII